MEKGERLNMGLIAEASAFLAGRIRTTPVEESPELSSRLGVQVALKLEFLQTTGSFKLRGAFFRLSRLSESERRTGVATCSAGNHGWALAYAGRHLRIPVTVYLPKSVDVSKKHGIEKLGARVIVSDFPGYDQTERIAKEECLQRGLPFISAFDDISVMAGNGGTLAQEIVEQIPEVGTFIFPVGGGGLAAGLSVVAASTGNRPTLIACQHEKSPALQLSLERGSAVTELPPIETLAGGVEGGLGKLTFPHIRDSIRQVALVSEEEILDALIWFLDRHHYLIEPSSAVVLAACLSQKVAPLSSPAVLILTGRNVSLQTLRKVLGKSQ